MLYEPLGSKSDVGVIVKNSIPSPLYHPDALHFLVTHTNFFPNDIVKKILRHLINGLYTDIWHVLIDADEPDE